MTTENSRADALMIPRDLLNDLIDDVQSFADQVPCREREKAFRADLLARARAFAGSPSLQPAAAPTDDRCYAPSCGKWDGNSECTCAKPAPSPADERAAWQTGVPPVKEGSYAGFIVACRRKHNGEVYVFEANYANQYAEELRDDDGEEFTAHGWYDVAQDIHGEYSSIFSKTCGEGDEIVGWQPLPKWSDQARAASASETGAEAVATLHDDGYYVWNPKVAKPGGYDRAGWKMPVYASPQPAQADAREEAYVAKRMAETLATVYATIVGDDQVDENDGLNAIQRCERAAQVLRLEVELYRGQADARVGHKSEGE